MKVPKAKTATTIHIARRRSNAVEILAAAKAPDKRDSLEMRETELGIERAARTLPACPNE
jgi:hypothetical protein